MEIEYSIILNEYTYISIKYLLNFSDLNIKNNTNVHLYKMNK